MWGLRLRWAGGCLALLFLLVLSGCGDRATVSGTVSYDGQDIPEGRISFFPLEGGATAESAPIHNGSYRITGLTLGKKRVWVSMTKQIEIPATGADGEAPVPEMIPVAQELIPPDAVGNNQTVEVTAGSQTLDLHLEKPRRP